MILNDKYELESFHHYCGLIHVHSTFSDGSRPIPEIAQIANELNEIRFLLITDHNTLRGKREGFEGWYGKVLVGIGNEINDKDDHNHYLAFNVGKEFGPAYSAQEYVQRVDELGGLGFIAHPDENRQHIRAYPPYPWTLWDSQHFHGIEIWNQMSEWMEGLTHLNKFWRILHPRRSIVSPKKLTLRRWDELNLKRKVVGIGGVDAHGFVHRLAGPFAIRVFRYKVSFKTIRTHILTQELITPKVDFVVALKRLYAALRSGRCFVSHRYLGDASDFRFFARNKHGFALMGDELPFNEQTELTVQIPQKGKVILIYNGKKVEEKIGRELHFRAHNAGIYRVEVTVHNRPWIFSNHVRLINDEVDSVHF